jgi:tRNA pseudouridine32 synthase/23S rRNA pseudouridine746 synthase
LAAYSGLLAGRNDWPFFVPPVFDAQQPDGHFKQTERIISSINDEVKNLPSTSPRLDQLKQQRKQLSEELQLWLFRQYRMLNALGEEKDLIEIWRNYHPSAKIQQRFPLPPGGSGDCCAPKLLQYAYQHHLHPVAIAEFWFGQSPKAEIRHHNQFYPACRGKCLPILTHMLQGLGPVGTLKPQADLTGELKTIYEDDTLLVVDKPSGLLSVPGRIDAPSVQSVLMERYGSIFMPHRLDMDT